MCGAYEGREAAVQVYKCSGTMDECPFPPILSPMIGGTGSFGGRLLIIGVESCKEQSTIIIIYHPQLVFFFGLFSFVSVGGGCRFCFYERVTMKHFSCVVSLVVQVDCF